MSKDSDEHRYFEMTIDIGLVGCEQKVIVGPVPDSEVDDDTNGSWPSSAYWLQRMWEHVSVTFEEIDEEKAKKRM